jgi:hypothetical protein
VKRSKILSGLLLFVFVSMQMEGCVALVAGGAAGAGTVVYIKGQLDEDINAPVSRVFGASISALKDLGLPLIEERHDRLSAKIKSEFADGSDVWIEIESLTSQSCKITIRVGIMGDEYKSRQILDRIHKHISAGGRNS